MNMKNSNLFRQLLSVLIIIFSFSTLAEEGIESQISRFQQLSKEQQQALIKPLMEQPSFSNHSLSSFDALDKGILDRSLGSEQSSKENEQVEERKNKDKTQLVASELSRFGLSLFAGSPSSFTPLNEVPISADYVLGPNDEIIIQTYGKQNQEYRLRVQRNGNINFPVLGTMNVAGMNFSQMQQFISQRIEEQIIGVRSNISLGELRSMQIFVLGDAYKPGAYSVNALTTISQAIYLSGGFSENGSLRKVQLKRNGQLIRILDLYDLLLKGDTSNDLRLLPGDTVFIGSVDKTVAVYGEVNRPAIYEITATENLQDVIAMAGGLTPNALPENVRIKRQVKQGLAKIVNANLSAKQGQEILIQKGDDINVITRGGQLQHYVSVEGDVVNPGLVAWKPGLKISDLFVSIESAFYETTDLSYALVVRRLGTQQNIQLLQFNLENALLYSKSSKDNIRLESKDKIIIFNRYELSEEQHTEAVKTLEQAQEQSKEDKKQIAKILGNDIAVSSQKLQLLSRDKNISKEEIERIKATSRKVLLSPILIQLEQHATLTRPAPIVEVMGEVKSPGRYPLTTGARVSDLIIAAGGLTEKAFLTNAELSRTSTDFQYMRRQLSVSQFNLGSALRNAAKSNLTLVPYDKLNVLQSPGSNQSETLVTLKGEVRFPGSYTIVQGETLGQLLKRAGGLTKYADPQGAIFTREVLRLQEEKLLRDYVNDIRQESFKKALRADSNMYSDPSKALALIEEASQTKALGRMVIELKEVLENKKTADFALEDGDFLFVPRFKNTISIIGEVQVAVTYLLDEKLTIKDYINKAGGLKKQADENRIFVMRANGSVFKPEENYWFTKSAQKLTAGDTIIVPIDTHYRDPLTLWGTATQMLYQTGVAVNALKR